MLMWQMDRTCRHVCRSVPQHCNGHQYSLVSHELKSSAAVFSHQCCSVRLAPFPPPQCAAALCRKSFSQTSLGFSSRPHPRRMTDMAPIILRTAAEVAAVASKGVQEGAVLLRTGHMPQAKHMGAVSCSKRMLFAKLGRDNFYTCLRLFPCENLSLPLQPPRR